MTALARRRHGGRTKHHRIGRLIRFIRNHASEFFKEHHFTIDGKVELLHYNEQGQLRGPRLQINRLEFDDFKYKKPDLVNHHQVVLRKSMRNGTTLANPNNTTAANPAPVTNNQNAVTNDQ